MILSHSKNYCKLNVNKREGLLTKKQTLFILILLNLMILVFGMEIINIAQLDESLSLIRNYWFECVKDKEPPFMSYEEYLIRCYKENIFESFILVPMTWVALSFFIDIIDDLVNLKNIKEKVTLIL